MYMLEFLAHARSCSILSRVTGGSIRLLWCSEESCTFRLLFLVRIRKLHHAIVDFRWFVNTRDLYQQSSGMVLVFWFWVDEDAILLRNSDWCRCQRRRQCRRWTAIQMSFSSIESGRGLAAQGGIRIALPGIWTWWGQICGSTVPNWVFGGGSRLCWEESDFGEIELCFCVCYVCVFEIAS